MSDQLSYFFSELMGIKAPFNLSEVSLRSEGVVDIKIEVSSDYRPSSFHTIHSYKERSWRHLDVMQYECHLHCRLPIFLDTRSGTHSLLEVPWAVKGSGFTLLFEEQALDLLKLTACKKSVADFLGLYPQRIETIYNRHTLAAYQSRDIEVAKRIGLDETSTKKGHEYITVFWDMDNDKLLDIREGRSSQVLDEFVEELHLTGQHPDKEIEEIVCDMSPAFVKGIKDNLPASQVTFDRFHVVQLINRYFEPLIKASSRDKVVLFEHLDQLDLLWQQPTDLEGAAFLSFWMHRTSELFGMTRLIRSLKKHFDGIVAYCRTHLTNGKLEGLNNKIQWIKRAARGYRSKESFMRMIHFIIGDLNTVHQTIS